MTKSTGPAAPMSTPQPPPKIPCPHCQALIKAPALAAGSLVNCPKCGQAFRLGEAEDKRGQGTGVRGQESRVGSQGGVVQGPKSKVQSPAVAKPQAAGSVPQPPSSKPPPSAPVKRPLAQPVVPREFTSAATTTQ